MKRVSTMLTGLGSQVKMALIALTLTMICMAAISQQQLNENTSTVHIKGKVYEHYDKLQESTVQLYVLRTNDQFEKEWLMLDSQNSVSEYDYILSSKLEYMIEFTKDGKTKILRVYPGPTGKYQFNIDVSFVSSWSMLLMPKEESTGTYHCKYMILEDIVKI